jgi:hypothetical protein
MVILTAGFPRVFLEKRLELKSLKGRTKAEEEGTPCPFLLSLRPPLKARYFEPCLRKNLGRTAESRVHRRGTDPLLKIAKSIFVPGFTILPKPTVNLVL